MLSSTIRPMTEDEARRIDTSLALPEAGLGCAMHFILLVGLPLLGMLLAAAPARLLELLRICTAREHALIFVACGALAGFGAAIWIERREKGFLGSERRAWAADRERAEVEVLHCEVSEAIELENDEDEGPGFFLDLGESRILFVQGQHLESPPLDTEFPNTSFDIIRTPRGGYLFDIVCRGRRLVPSRSFACPGLWLVLHDGEVLTGRLESLETDMAELKKSRARRPTVA